MNKLRDFLNWHCENPHNINFKMIIGKEDREDTLKAMHEVSEFLDTGLTPEQIMELKERDTEKVPAEVREECSYFECPSCGELIYATDELESHHFCLNCGQRIKWED